MFQFIHAADLHLDSPLRGLARFEGAPVARMQSATREAFHNLVQLAVDERVAFVVIAGDLWDGAWPDSAPVLFFIEQAARLARAGIPIYIVKGNHDAESKLTSAIRHWPSNVFFFDHRGPNSFLLEQWNVALHGQSYREQHVTDDLSAGYPAPVPGAFNIGVLHTCLDDGGTDYAPASLAGLAAHGYDYWALGHVHDRRDASRDRVHIEFPGNTQGRSIRETGPKGCSLVTVAEGRPLVSRFEALDTVRWECLAVEGDDAGIESAVRQVLEHAVAECDGRLLAARLEVTGNVARGEALRDRLTGVALEVGDVWIERIVAHSPADGRVTAGDPLPLAVAEEVRRLVDAAATDDEELAAWMAEFAELRGRLSGELSDGDAARALSDPRAFRQLLAEAGGQLR